MPSESSTTAATSSWANCRGPPPGPARARWPCRSASRRAGSAALERSACSAKAMSRRRKSPLSFSHHFDSLSRAWSKRGVPEASSAMLIEAEVSSRKISAGRSAVNLDS